MTTTQKQTEQRTCPNCGAPIVSEICAYCGTRTGLNTAKADMEYPVYDCKEASLNFWTTWFPAIFAVAFGVSGLGMLMAFIFSLREYFLLLMGIGFFLVGIAATVIIIRAISRYLKVKIHGKNIQGIVYGYMDDNVMYNNKPGQIVKILVHTPNGPRFILYQLGNTLKPYGINDKINLKVYKNCFMICNNEEIIEW